METHVYRSGKSGLRECFCGSCAHPIRGMHLQPALTKLKPGEVVPVCQRSGRRRGEGLNGCESPQACSTGNQGTFGIPGNHELGVKVTRTVPELQEKKLKDFVKPEFPRYLLNNRAHGGTRGRE